MFQYLGLILVLISWTAGTYLVQKWHDTYAMSISKHAASAKGASRLFAIVLGGGSVLFYWWLIQWFRPHLELGAIFTVLVGLTATAQIIVGIVPDTIGWRHHIHQKAAAIMAVCYAPLTYLILTSTAIDTPTRVIVYVCITCTIAAGLFLFSVKRARDYYLFFQSLYIVAFQVIILSVAYL
jgi:hypothetical protein